MHRLKYQFGASFDAGEHKQPQRLIKCQGPSPLEIVNRVARTLNNVKNPKHNTNNTIS